MVWPMRRAAPPAPAPAPPSIDPASRAPRVGATAAVVGGYRLVRLLGDDDEVVTWLARGGEETVVLRVFRESASDARIDAEIGARERLTGPHVPALLDLATGPGGRPVAVLAVVVGPVLRDVIARWARPLRAGHVTTILAPLAALLDAAHEVGATLGRLDTAGIRLDPSGAPVVMSFARAHAAAPLPARFRDQEEAVVEDRRALDALASELAEMVDPHERDSVLAAIARGVGDPAALELALFDCAAPLPLGPLRDVDAEPVGPARRVEGDDAAPLVAPASRARVRAGANPIGPLGATARPSREAPAGEHPQAAGLIGQVGRRLGIPTALLDPVEGAVHEFRTRLSSVRRRSQRKRPTAQRPRRGVIIAGAAGALALAAAIGLASLEADAEAGSRPDALPPSPSAAAVDAGTQSSEDGAAGPISDAEEPSAGEGSTQLPESAGDPSTEQWSPLVGALIDRWLACAEAPSAECASSAAHAGSAAEEALFAQVDADPAAASSPAVGRGRLTLESWAASVRELVVVDRQGAAAVVDLVDEGTTTASLLVVRSEAGWRLRAVMPIERIPPG